jgi:hypothetical protein
MFLLVASMFLTVRAAGLTITLTVKDKNNLGDPISTPGNLTQNDSPVTDALVALEVDDPHHNPFLMRTLTTGGTPAGPWQVELLQFITCSSAGNPQSDFRRGQYGGLGLKITVINNGATPQHVNVTVTLFYSNMVPFGIYDIINEDMSPGANETTYAYPLPIPDSALLGQAFAYASTLSAWPKNYGRALSPENFTSFNIVSGGGGGGASYAPEEFQTLSSPGEFNTTFRTNGYGGITGNYTVTATSFYELSYTSTQKTFNVYLAGDVNGDGKVRVDDVLYEAQHFGTNEGDPGWDPRCDWNGDRKVRVDDVLIVAQAFGKQSSP